MTALLIALDRQPYLRVAIICFALLVAALIFGIQKSLIPPSWRYLWQVLTGGFLLAAIHYQWFLLFDRLSPGGAPQKSRSRYANHRWVGSFSFLLFALHAVSIGHMLTNILALLFLACGLSGVLNREIIRYRKKWMYQLWFGAHIALSAIMAPLIIAHIWIALAYEGFSFHA